MIFFNFIFNFFINLQFIFRFNPIRGQLRPNKDHARKRIREQKEKKHII
jgi:hypothetical protein